MAPRAARMPRRARHLIPGALPRRGELVAACAVAVVLGHLLLAQLTLVLAVAFALAGRATRWRLGWLLVPAAAGLAWTLAVGPEQAVAGFAAGPSSVLSHLGIGNAAQQAGHPLAAFSGIRGWLPRQLPLALLAAAAEAAVLGWLDWLHTDEWAVPRPRPGVVAALRAAAAARFIRSGAVLTRDGCALGTVPASGAVAGLRWAEISHGVLVAGSDAQEVALASLQVVHAALRRRKPVIVLAGRRDTAVAGALAAACRATGTPLPPDGATGPAEMPGPGPGSVPATVPAGRPLVTQGAVSASQLWGRDRGREDGPRPGPDTGTGFTGTGFTGTGFTGTEPIDLGRVVRERSAALLPADSPELAERACADLASLAADLRRIGVDGDALVWVPHGERLPALALAALLRDGPAGGLSVLVGTTSPAAAAELGGLTGTTLVRRLADPVLAAVLAPRTGMRLLPQAAAAAAAGQQPTGGPAPAAPGIGVPGAGVPAGGAAPAAFGPAPAAFGPGPGVFGSGPVAGVAAAPAADLVPCPAVPARNLLTLGPAEFVLAVNAPRQRLIALGRLVPARLPRAPGGPGTEEDDRGTEAGLGARTGPETELGAGTQADPGARAAAGAGS
jgi:hypothetical protein